MKRALIGLSVLVALTLISIFIFIPAHLNVSVATGMKANTNALFRNLSNEENWNNWWPDESLEKKAKIENSYQFQGHTYRVREKLYNAVAIDIMQKDETINGKIVIIPIAEDSLIVQWNSALTAGFNPFSRLQQYRHGLTLKKSMSVILDSLKSFAENKEEVYKYHIRHTTLKDTTLVAIKTITSNYPSPDTIYKLITDLRKYIAGNKANETDYPILNVTRKDSSYEVMVAIPTDKVLKGNGNIVSKRMIAYKDKVLTADVTGGPDKIQKAYDELHLYMSDYNLISPVIHWETLITDRSKEKDSSKWVTKICIPIV